MIAGQLLAPFSGPLVPVAKAGESDLEFEVIKAVTAVKVVSIWIRFSGLCSAFHRCVL